MLRKNGNAGADPHRSDTAIDVEGSMHRGDQPFGDGAGLLQIVHGFLKHGEFVAAQPGKHVARAEHGREPPHGFGQHDVADGMSENVVHLLEAVEIETQDRDVALFRSCRFQSPFEAILERDAIGESGQGIVVRKMPDPGFRLAKLAYVADGKDAPAAVV